MLIYLSSPSTSLTSSFNGPHGVRTAHISYRAIATRSTHVVHYMWISTSKSHIREERKQIAHKTTDKHQEPLLQGIRRVLTENANHRDHAQVEENKNGGQEIPADVVLRHHHVEHKPACITNRHKCSEVEEAVQYSGAVILVQKDHDKRDQCHEKDNYKGVDHSLPNRIPRCIRFFLVDHVHSTESRDRTNSTSIPPPAHRLIRKVGWHLLKCYASTMQFKRTLRTAWSIPPESRYAPNGSHRTR